MFNFTAFETVVLDAALEGTYTGAGMNYDGELFIGSWENPLATIGRLVFDENGDSLDENTLAEIAGCDPDCFLIGGPSGLLPEEEAGALAAITRAWLGSVRRSLLEQVAGRFASAEHEKPSFADQGLRAAA